MNKIILLATTLCLLLVVLVGCNDENNPSDSLGSESMNENDTFMGRVVADGERVFVLENMTDRERSERMTSVTLYADGTATIANALISSFVIPSAPHTIFTIENNELAIFRNISDDEDGEGHNTTIARFTIIDNDTLEFLSAGAGVPLFADARARYIFDPDGFDIFAGLNHNIEPIPHVGAAHETHRIVTAMPLPRSYMPLRSIQIGADHGGFGYGVYTLTIHYDFSGDALDYIPGEAFEQIAASLFDLIENLEAVTFSLVSIEESDVDNYIVRWSISRTSSDAGGGAVTSFRGLQQINVIPQEILDQIYLGMTNERVRELFGEPDFHASGLTWYGYNDIGIFGPTSSTTGVVERISLVNGISWSVSELISTAVIQQFAELFYAPEGSFATEAHTILALDANPQGFSVYVVSLYMRYLPDGEHDVREISGGHSPIVLTFSRNQNNQYELVEFWEPEPGTNYMSSIHARFPESTWSRIDTQRFINNHSERTRFQAINFFFGEQNQEATLEAPRGESDAVYMRVDEVYTNANMVTVTMFNHTDYEFITSLHFIVEFFDGLSWRKVPWHGGFSGVFVDVGYDIQPHDSISFTKNLGLVEPLNSGLHRIKKSVFRYIDIPIRDGDLHDIVAEFYLSEPS